MALYAEISKYLLKPKMKHINRAVAVSIFVIALTLQACTTLYVQPEGKDVAVLRIKNDTAGLLIVDAFESGAECRGRLALTPDRTMPAFGELAINVKPGEPFSFYVGYLWQHGLKRAGCDFLVTFNPRANGQYTARLSVNASEQKCYMPLMVQTTSGEQPESSVRLRKFRELILNESSSFCE